ncbi:MAG: DUF4350 domain-containing protein [Myxococcales bacterium]|nr:MAG: DUF4350 domain-containing protein [Myxococcales bacterium]
MSVEEAQLEKTLKEAYAPGALPFCHDPKYRLRFSDRDLCELSQAELQRCPALEKSCSLPALKRHEAQEAKADSRMTIPGWLGYVAEGLLWLLLIGLVLGVLGALLRMQRTRRQDDREPEPAEAEESNLPAASAPAPPADTDVQRLLSKARQAAERGELGPAIDAAHAAAMQGLSAAGQIELERDRTNGDYLRDLRKAPPVYADFRAIVGQVETAQFGGAPPTRAAFDSVLDKVTSMLRRLAVLSLLALMGCGSGTGPSSETPDTSPSGLYTFKRLLLDQGAKVHTRIKPLAKLEDVSAIVVFSSDLEDEEKDLLLKWVNGGGVLISVGTSAFDEAGDVQRRYTDCGRRAKYMNAEGPDVSLKFAVLGGRTLKVDSESPVSHFVLVECGGEPYIVNAFPGAGAIHYVPEPELLSNASLSVADNARLVAEVVQVGEGETVELVGPWTGSGSQSPIQSLQAAGMMPFMLQLLALGLLLALRQGTSFGARRDDARLERRAFADHVRALASTYHRASAGHLVSGQYTLLLMEQLRDRLFPGQSPTLLQLASGVARRTGRAEGQVVQLLVEAKSGLDDAVEGAAVNHQLIRELEQLYLQVGGVS